jgi:hypothetical protein
MYQWLDRFYPKQRDYINALKDSWEVLFLAGNGAGKTRNFYWNLNAFALGIHPHQIAEPPLTIKVLINDFEHGLEKIFKETNMQPSYLPDGSTIGPMLPKSAIKKYWSRDDKSITFKNGSIMFFQTSEQKKRQHSGTNIDILGCDEEAEKQVYDESKRGLRNAKGGGRILHAFTPPFDEETKNKGPTWTKFDLVDPFDKGEAEDICVIRAAMRDNPAITDDFIRKFSRGKTEQQLRIQLYGEYPTWGKLIFPEFLDDMWDAKTKMGHILPWDFDVPWGDPDVNFEMAVDWHGSKPCAVVWMFEYMTGPNKGDLIFFDELSPLAGKGMTIFDTSNAIMEIENHTKRKIKRWCDPKMKDKNNALVSGFCPHDEFRHCGLRLSPAWNREPYTGYSIMRDYLNGKGNNNPDHPRMFITENCKTLRHNMKNHYNVPKGGGDASPDPKFSDYCVNAKYIVQQKARKVKRGMDTTRQHWGITSYGDPAAYKNIDYSTFVPRFR